LNTLGRGKSTVLVFCGKKSNTVQSFECTMNFVIFWYVCKYQNFINYFDGYSDVLTYTEQI